MQLICSILTLFSNGFFCYNFDCTKSNKLKSTAIPINMHWTSGMIPASITHKNNDIAEKPLFFCFAVVKQSTPTHGTQHWILKRNRNSPYARQTALIHSLLCGFHRFSWCVFFSAVARQIHKNYMLTRERQKHRRVVCDCIYGNESYIRRFGLVHSYNHSKTKAKFQLIVQLYQFFFSTMWKTACTLCCLCILWVLFLCIHASVFHLVWVWVHVFMWFFCRSSFRLNLFAFFSLHVRFVVVIIRSLTITHEILSSLLFHSVCFRES